MVELIKNMAHLESQKHLAVADGVSVVITAIWIEMLDLKIEREKEAPAVANELYEKRSRH